MNLAEILCTSEDEADSVYKVIEQGQSFKELAMKYSVDPSREMGGILGKVNINVFRRIFVNHSVNSLLMSIQNRLNMVTSTRFLKDSKTKSILE